MNYQPEWQPVDLNENIRIFGGPVLLNVCKRYKDKINPPNNALIFVYEGWENVNDEILAMSHPIAGIRSCLDFSKNEQDRILNLTWHSKDQRIPFYSRNTETYVIRISDKILNRQEIDMLCSVFHEIRHVQQFCYRNDAFRLLNEQKERDQRTYADMGFEQDAIIWSREKLIEAGFSWQEIERLFRKIYPTKFRDLLKTKPMILEAVFSEVQSFANDRQVI